MSSLAPAVSVVVPMHNEEGNAGALVREIAAALAGQAFEIVAVNDASKDGTLAELQAVKAEVAQLRIVSHRSNAGQSRAVRTGFMMARAPVVCTLDGDGQNPPADLPALIAQLTRDGAPGALAMVGGERVGRQDSAWKKFASRVGNGIRKRLLNDEAKDTGCGIKAMRREAYLALPYFDHQHRFLPALMKREGYTVEFHPVSHRPRTAGTSKYTNIGRLFASISDIMGVMWLNSRSRQTGGWEES